MDKLTKAQQKLMDEFELNGPIHVLPDCSIMIKSGRTAHKRVVNNLVEKKCLVGANDALIDGIGSQTFVLGKVDE